MRGLFILFVLLFNFAVQPRFREQRRRFCLSFMASSPSSRCDVLQEELVHSEIALLQSPDGVVKAEGDVMPHEIALDDDDETPVRNVSVAVVRMTDDEVAHLDGDVTIHDEADDSLKTTVKSEGDLDVEDVAEVDADPDGIMHPDNDDFIAHSAASAPPIHSLSDGPHDERDDEQLLHDDPTDADESVNIEPVITRPSQSSVRDPHNNVAIVGDAVSNIDVGPARGDDRANNNHDDVGVPDSVTPLAHVHTDVEADVDSGTHHALHDITLTHDGTHGAQLSDFLPASSSSSMPLHHDTGRESPASPSSLHHSPHLHLMPMTTRTQSHSADAVTIVAAADGTQPFQPHLTTQLHLGNIAYPQPITQRPRKKRRTYNSEEERRNARILKNRRTAEESRQRRLKRMQDLEENARNSKEREHALLQQLEQAKAELDHVSKTLQQSIERKNALLSEKDREIQELRNKLNIKGQN